MMAAQNLFAYSAQVMLLVLVCAGLPRLLRLSAPALQLVFWRTLLALCVLLPLVQPWRSLAVERAPGAAVDSSALAAAPPDIAAASGPVGDAARGWMALVAVVLVAGIGVRLLWIAAGVARLHRLRRRATADTSADFDDLRRTINTSATILWTADLRHPVTFGFFTPVVLLPDALKAADAGALRAVVAHELFHVQRRDWVWLLGEEIVRAVFWFHPAMWWLVSRVQLARETVVDELSILLTNARRTYLDTLMSFADETGASSAAFSARRHLFYRVMLLSKEAGMSSIRVSVASFVLVAALGGGTLGAVRAFPLHAATQDQRPPRDPLTPEAHHRLAQQYWQKANSDTTLTPEQRLDTILKGIAAEDRALAMNPDYVPSIIYKNIFLRMQANLARTDEERRTLIRQADELKDKATALQPAATPGRASPAPQDLPASPEFQAIVDRLKPLRVGGNIKPPVKVRDVKPAYPPEAQADRVQGVVIIEAVLDEDGKIAAARVLRSIPMLDEAALVAVKQWQFTPTLMNGAPAAMMMTVTVNFTLQ